VPLHSLPSCSSHGNSSQAAQLCVSGQALEIEWCLQVRTYTTSTRRFAEVLGLFIVVTKSSFHRKVSRLDSMSFTAHRFFGRLSSCSVTSIPSPPWRWPSSRYHTSPSGSNYLHSVCSLTPKPCSPIKLSSVIPKWCGARTSSHYHRVRHHDYGTPLGGVFTRFTFHTLRKTPGSRHREI
jgi:hypothetical protein